MLIPSSFFYWPCWLSSAAALKLSFSSSLNTASWRREITSSCSLSFQPRLKRKACWYGCLWPFPDALGVPCKSVLLNGQLPLTLTKGLPTWTCPLCSEPKYVFGVWPPIKDDVAYIQNIWGNKKREQWLKRTDVRCLNEIHKNIRVINQSMHKPFLARVRFNWLLLFLSGQFPLVVLYSTEDQMVAWGLLWVHTNPQRILL